MLESKTHTIVNVTRLPEILDYDNTTRDTINRKLMSQPTKAKQAWE